jgi:muramoyltetrapeptide carboxypeptidase LdcA involved in peptidoglycan recycling
MANVLLLKDTLNRLGIEVEFSKYMFTNDGNAELSAQLKADSLMQFYRDETITHIVDVSGGDSANEVLPLLDYTVISNSGKPFMGYSDLSTVLNAIYTKTGNAGYLYSIRNLIRECSTQQLADFESTFLDGTNALFDIDYTFLRGDSLQGTLIGGNVRCLAKLFGTPYAPDFNNRVLLLESRGGGVELVKSLLNQYQQVGVFNQVRGVVLGTFSHMENHQLVPTVETMLLNLTINNPIPIVKTYSIGHEADSKCVKLGTHYVF